MGFRVIRESRHGNCVKIAKILWETVKRKNGFGEGQRKAKAIHPLPSDACKTRPE